MSLREWVLVHGPKQGLRLWKIQRAWRKESEALRASKLKPLKEKKL